MSRLADRLARAQAKLAKLDEHIVVHIAGGPTLYYREQTPRQHREAAPGSKISTLAPAEAPMRAGHSAGHSVSQPCVTADVESRAEHRQSRARASIAPRLLSYQQAAEYLGVSYWTIRSWAESGKLPIVKLPGSRLLRVERAELDRFVDACRVA
jgi:excisionase family DNA binding protein